MRIASAIDLDETERKTLETLSKSGCVSVRLSQRAKIVLLAAEGCENHGIGKRLGITRQKAGRWRSRFTAEGLAGIEKDVPRSGRNRTFDDSTVEEVIRKTLREKPENATH